MAVLPTFAAPLAGLPVSCRLLHDTPDAFYKAHILPNLSVTVAQACASDGGIGMNDRKIHKENGTMPQKIRVLFVRGQSPAGQRGLLEVQAFATLG
jgi:hypothetical protein